MRKYRSWLMGLGIGLILGASMLQLILTAKGQAGKSAAMPLTRDQIKEQASKEGFVVYAAEAKIYTEEELQVKVDEAVKQAELKTESAIPSPSASPAAEAPKVVTLNVRRGMTLTEVADKLEELGVVKDGDDFLDISSSIAKDLKIGTSIFIGKPTYREIITELTRSKP